MGTHLIPREIDGDARILLIFTPKGFVGTLIGIAIGAFFYSICDKFGATVVGWVILGIFALIGFVVGQVRIPDSTAFSLFKKVGGDLVQSVIVKYVAFKKKRKIYIYDPGEKGYTTEQVQKK